MLWLAAYVFMLRVPSEALPMMKGGDGVSGHSALRLESSSCVVLHLKSRKNRPQVRAHSPLCCGVPFHFVLAVLRARVYGDTAHAEVKTLGRIRFA